MIARLISTSRIDGSERLRVGVQSRSYIEARQLEPQIQPERKRMWDKVG